MEQRPLRLGDIVDDYCPRERRITNHVIVAIVEDAIRQTRCTTCDAEHVYKHAREPLRRRKDAPATTVPVLAAAAPPADQATAEEEHDPVALPDPVADVDPAFAAAPASEPVHVAPEATETHPDDGWLAHRRLIRASLPRVEGEPPAPRPIPEFTMHQRPSGRGGHGFRFGRGGSGHGNMSGRGDGSHGQGDRNGNRAGNGGGRGRRHGHGKRSR